MAQAIYNHKITFSGDTTFVLPDSTTAISFSMLQGQSLWLETEVETIAIQINEHLESGVSQLVLCKPTQKQIRLVAAENGRISIILQGYRASYRAITKSKVAAQLAALAYKKGDCNMPAAIDQSIWRKDLPPPKPNPIATQVQHVIIHHSATSNSITDYLMAVRNIYLYHVNNNGWDDVGYNYLISPDGVLWAGRDGQGSITDDNVKGAHFCGKNSNTMGVCLIGNYSEKPPTDTMLGTLRQLVAWKVKKENLQPLEYSFHPVGSPSGFMLPVICGHRDGHKEGVFSGCQTECPGNYTYQLLDSIRQQVVRQLKACQYAVGLAENHLQNLQITRVNSLLMLQNSPAAQWQIIDMSGKVVMTGQMKNQTSIDVSSLKGLFILNVASDKANKYYKFIN
ncbi:T9SS type A sorting domain-containing protein [bacterium]|nr:T9SS type A sorting domain-containing protein [bacterium]